MKHLYGLSHREFANELRQLWIFRSVPLQIRLFDAQDNQTQDLDEPVRPRRCIIRGKSTYREEVECPRRNHSEVNEGSKASTERNKQYCDRGVERSGI